MKRIAVIVFLSFLLASVFVLGCDDEEKISTEQLTEGITAALEDMETYQFNISQVAEASDETDNYNSSTEINGIVDNTSKKMQFTMGVESKRSNETYSMEFEHYLISNMEYTKAVYDGVPEQWMKAPIKFEDWEENPILMQIALREGSDIKVLGSEDLDGTECWEIKIIPSLEKYLEVIGEEAVEFSPEELSELISVKQWYAKDTYYLMKAEMQWTIVDSGYSSTTTMDTGCSHYNEPVSIELPAEAEEADLVE